MSEVRRNFRFNTQKAYGGYCNLCKSKSKEPVEYHRFSEMFEQGMTVKEIADEGM